MEFLTNQSPRSKNALGRGLRSLIPGADEPDEMSKSVPGAALRNMDVRDLQPGSGQPRQAFDEESLKDLSASILEHGIIQPLVIRKLPKGKFEIIAGERRWRAAKAAGLTVVPCVVSDIATQDVIKVALVENIQREDLNAIEEAQSFQRLHEELGLTHDQIAQSVGKDRSTIANSMRLLKLPESVRALVVGKRVSMGHARALLSLRDNQRIELLAKKIAKEGLSVRATEKLVQKDDRSNPEEGSNQQKRLRTESVEERNIRRRLESALGTRVEIQHKKGKGTLTLHFSDIDQLNDLIDKMTKIEC